MLWDYAAAIFSFMMQPYRSRECRLHDAVFDLWDHTIAFVLA
jgi:hypothetical protein